MQNIAFSGHKGSTCFHCISTISFFYTPARPIRSNVPSQKALAQSVHLSDLFFSSWIKSGSSFSSLPGFKKSNKANYALGELTETCLHNGALHFDLSKITLWHTPTGVFWLTQLHCCVLHVEKRSLHSCHIQHRLICLQLDLQ